MTTNNQRPYYNSFFDHIPKRHTRGPRCRQAPVIQPFSSADLDHIPPVKAQFFYTSLIPIDDPLSTSTIAATADPKSSRAVLQPFSPGDNNALETAWLSLASDEYHSNHSQARQNRGPSPALTQANDAKLQTLIQQLALQHSVQHATENRPRDSMQSGVESPPQTDLALPLCCSDLLPDVGIALRSSFCPVARRQHHILDREHVAQLVLNEMKKTRPGVQDDTSFGPPPGEDPAPCPERPSSHQSTRIDSLSEVRGRSDSRVDVGSGNATPVRASFADDGISGKPFIRVGTPESVPFSPSSSLPRAATANLANKSVENTPPRDLRGRGQVSSRPRSTQQPPGPTPGTVKESPNTSASVPVGVSRLHEVALPALQMKPIYWSPVNDIATVLRATWFYKDNMRPVDPTVANQLEAGYRELKPHTETWADELHSAIDVGPLGEEKISHPLWPKEPKAPSKKNPAADEPPISNNPFCAARCFRGEAAAEGSLLPTTNEDNSAQLHPQRKFEQYHVIYKDESTAFLLKPSLKPSAYYGRRPLAKIFRGITVGIPVVRGFDHEVWLQKHQKKQAQSQSIHQSKSATENSQASSSSQGPCPACEAEKKRGQVTDLVLVIHGIGQKLAERVETYHFTHAINAFRRAMNIELGNDSVRSVLREDQNGIMVLPVNWRQTLSFEDGGTMQEEDEADRPAHRFGLKDIEPNTIPAVRSMISDVMFDVPFYMSHHKPKMVTALVREANRVYRLWCRNNPGFSDNGRVHVIGHSLGSVMAVDVLSRQPTRTVPVQLSATPNLTHFEFDTRNLFLIGSPVAFFLLLERGALLPRKGRRKPGAEPADTVTEGIVGEAGIFGCVAVDNIYNILAREDAVAYLLNGTVDPKYAASLKTAHVPSASAGFFQYMGNAVRSMVPGSGPAPASVTNAALARPPVLRLPSNVELDVHDFTREELAEKKAFLLNDNGQIDYFLRSGNGPLELQYLNMLSAHSSYWSSHDLIRMLCMEIGRQPGRENTLPAMRAVKASKRNIPLMT